MQGKTILLGVCGGIAAYKSADLCSKLVQSGANVHVIMTESAKQFVAPLTFQTLSRNAVAADTFEERNPSVVSHIDLADSADLVIVAPATANMLAKMAHGLADDMLSTTLLAVTADVFAAPAMNVHMYQHPAVRANIEILAARGVRFIEPGEGQLACGYTGKGRLAEPEDIVKQLNNYFQRRQSWRNKRVLITAGGTVERIDPVRFLSNDSSGKMGIALAEAARDRGADVTLVAARTSAALPAGVRTVRAFSAEEMLQEVTGRYADMDVVLMAAAVSDFRPVQQAVRKIKKTEETLTLNLIQTRDILKTLGETKHHQFLVGFAAETNDLERLAQDKTIRKNCDLLVANDVSRTDIGIGADDNEVHVFGQEGPVKLIPHAPKRRVADQILDLVEERIKGQGASTCTPE